MTSTCDSESQYVNSLVLFGHFPGVCSGKALPVDEIFQKIESLVNTGHDYRSLHPEKFVEQLQCFRFEPLQLFRFGKRGRLILAKFCKD